MKKIKEIVIMTILSIGCGFYAADEAQPDAEPEPKTAWEAQFEPGPTLTEQIKKGIALKPVQTRSEGASESSLVVVDRGNLGFVSLFIGLTKGLVALQARDPVANPIPRTSVEIANRIEMESTFCEKILPIFKTIKEGDINLIEALLSKAIEDKKLTLHIVDVAGSFEIKSIKTIEQEAMAGQKPNPRRVNIKISDDNFVQFTMFGPIPIGANVDLRSWVFENFIKKAQDILQKHKEEIQIEKARIANIQDIQRQIPEDAIRERNRLVNLGGG